MLSLVSVSPLCAVAAAPPLQQLQHAVTERSSLYNTSLSVAITLSNGTTVTAVGGYDDHVTGSQVTAASLFPGGSVTKTFMAVGAMLLVEQGKLSLDTPIHKILDPWLTAQGMDSLLKQWGDNPDIKKVTTRHLLSMRSGVRDYDDKAVQEWTLKHFSEDLLPQQYVANVSKSFEFKPGEGGAYTGVGYVLLGWVLSASSGAPTWDKLDQAGLIENTTDFRLGR